MKHPTRRKGTSQAPSKGKKGGRGNFRKSAHGKRTLSNSLEIIKKRKSRETRNKRNKGVKNGYWRMKGGEK